MDVLIELLLSFVFEGALLGAEEKRTPKWLRYPLIALVSIFILAIFLGLAAFAVWLFIRREYALDVPFGIVLLLLDGVLIFSAIRKIRRQIKVAKAQKERVE